MSLPDHLEQQRRNVTSIGETNFNVSTLTAANVYSSLGVDNSWNEEDWKRNFRVIVSPPAQKGGTGKKDESEKNEMEFDLVNLDPSIANALRRILISELPTVAIEHVFYVNNTSIIALLERWLGVEESEFLNGRAIVSQQHLDINQYRVPVQWQDEVLAHRLGLIPLNIDPDKLEVTKRGEVASERNTVVFKLKVHCRRLTPEKLENSQVLSSAFQWLPNGSEMPEETNCRFSGGQQAMFVTPAAPVHEDILVAKLRPGQCIDLEAHATKGLGAEHAKWSPVATAWYRLQPEVVLKKKVKGKAARHLAELCPGLFVVAKGRDGEDVAKVTSARGNEKQLEKVRHLANEPQWRDKLELRRKKEHFIFTIESVGVEPPETLFVKALDVLSAKCDKVLEGL